MSFSLQSVGRLVVMSLGYWLLDLAIREERVLRLALAAKRRHRALEPALYIIGLSAAVALFRWEHLPHQGVVRLLAVGLCALLTWKVVTKDIDVALGESNAFSRIALIGSCFGLWLSPAFVLPALCLLTRPFSQWRHHAILPMRTLLATAAFICLAELAAPASSLVQPYFPDVSTLIFFLLTIHASHYLSAGLAKLKLGPRWYSWVTDNRIHYISANAHAWGWARFIPWSLWLRLVKAVKVTEKPLQAVILMTELTAPLALLSPRVAVTACVVWSAFHLGVFIFSGIWFWDWIGANVVLALAVAALPEAHKDAPFGWLSVAASTLFIVAFPLRNKLWGPTPLAWWETPFTQRMHWFATGISGTIYEVYSEFMCPHQRLYGKIHACFLAPARLITFFLGTVMVPERRDAICSAGPSPERLDALRERFGAQPRDAKMAENHFNYLHRFFDALNRRARKHVLPRWLLWLKAPGGHIYYWGDMPAFRGQERVIKVTLRFREKYFDGERLVLLRDELVQEIDIDETSAKRPCEREPTARDMERFLSEALWSAKPSEPAQGESKPDAPMPRRDPRRAR
jgi:hypothetical protein